VSTGPLQEYSIVECATYISAPLGGLILAQLGAEVTKVEIPGTGDPFRGWGGSPDGRTTTSSFAAMNYGKKSVALDLKSKAGQDRYIELVGRSDAVIENYRPGVLNRLGVGEERLRALYPELVYCSVTAFGKDGVYARRPGYDAVVQGMSGLLGLLSPAPDVRVVGPPLADCITGLNVAIAVVAGLLSRAGGRKPVLSLDVSMLAATLGVMGTSVASFGESGESEDPFSRARSSQSYVWGCSDGKLLAVHLSSSEKFWSGLTKAVGRPDLRTEPRYQTYANRERNFDDLREELASVFDRRGRDEWLATLIAEDVPAAPVNTIADVVSDLGVRSAGIIREAVDARGKKFVVPGGGITFEGSERVPGSMTIPDLGSHTTADSDAVTEIKA
jgi:crotonobetainyl-CoA:carnitine CoA-transferase CaiB-like acyl-CoA transferase